MESLSMRLIRRIYDELYKVKTLASLGSKVDSKELEELDLMNFFQVILDHLSMMEHELSLLEANENKLYSELKEPIEEE